MPYDDVAGWEPAEANALTAAGVLTGAPQADSVFCDGCYEACLAEVETIGGVGENPPRAYVVCDQRDDMGRIEVPLERLQQWAPSASALAAWLARALGVKRQPEECVTDHLWWLGRAQVGAQRADVFLATGVADQNALELIASAPRLCECARPLVFVPLVSPEGCPFGAQAAVVSLARALEISDDALQLDIPAVGGGLEKRPPVPEPRGTLWLTIDDVSVVYRGRRVVLGPQALPLLSCLARRAGRVVSHRVLLEAVWPEECDLDTDKQLRQHVKVVNDALAAIDNDLAPQGADAPPRRIVATKSVGYCLELAPDQVSCQ